MTDKAPDGVTKEDDERGDAIMGRLLDQARESYGALGIVAMVIAKDNSFRYFAHGLTHVQINHALAVGIHMNMNGHDKKVAEATAAAAANSQGAADAAE